MVIRSFRLETADDHPQGEEMVQTGFETECPQALQRAWNLPKNMCELLAETVHSS